MKYCPVWLLGNMFNSIVFVYDEILWDKIEVVFSYCFCYIEHVIRVWWKINVLILWHQVMYDVNL